MAAKSSLSLLIKLALAVGVLAVAGFLVWNGFRHTAQVAVVKRDKAVDAVPGSIVVEADGGINELKSELGGIVLWCEPLDPTKSTSFKEGDVLLRLDPTDANRRFEEAKRQHDAAVRKRDIAIAKNSDREAAETALANAIRFREHGKASDEDVKAAQRKLDAVVTQLDLANFEFQKAQADFRSAQEEHTVLLEKMSIKAVYNGKVDQSFVRKGSLISPGATVATTYSDARVVVAKISEEEIGKVRIGQKAKVRLLSYPHEEFNAKVTKIRPIAEPNTQRYTVFLDVDIDPARLIPFSTGEVTITVAERENQPVIPRRALQAAMDGSHVLVVNNGRVERRKVEVGFVALNKAEILKGLADGEQVIVEALDQFRHGQRVRTQVVEQ